MEDLSNRARGSLAAESMAATNSVSTNHAMTAPGTVSESTAGEDQGDPAASVDDAQRYDGRQLQHGDLSGTANGAWVRVSGKAWGSR